MSTITNKIIRNQRIAQFDPNSDKWQKLGIEIFQLTPYQYRFSWNGVQIDYFPTSGKYHNITKDERGICPAYGILKLFEAC